MYEIKNWRENTGQSKVKGWFTLMVDDFEINDFKLVEGEEGDFIGLPSTAYEDKEGETKYRYNVWIEDKKRKYAFQDWALKELGKFVGIEPELPEDDGEKIPF